MKPHWWGGQNSYQHVTFALASSSFGASEFGDKNPSWLPLFGLQECALVSLTTSLLIQRAWWQRRFVDGVDGSELGSSQHRDTSCAVFKALFDMGGGTCKSSYTCGLFNGKYVTGLISLMDAFHLKRLNCSLARDHGKPRHLVINRLNLVSDVCCIVRTEQRTRHWKDGNKLNPNLNTVKQHVAGIFCKTRSNFYIGKRRNRNQQWRIWRWHVRAGKISGVRRRTTGTWK